ncbi:MAG: hypothetical protein E6G97_13955 [Alphaproteobacteria bacterium]|nr:MAG: hypothetical protein E6G97_13955 [Alphaproteobacteria bacterium]
MSKILAGIAGLTLMATAALPLQASAAEQKPGVANERAQSTELSSQRRYYRHRYYGRRYWGPRYYARPYWGPSYYGYGSPYYGYPGYYRPGLALGIGPFGFGIF